MTVQKHDFSTRPENRAFLLCEKRPIEEKYPFKSNVVVNYLKQRAENFLDVKKCESLLKRIKGVIASRVLVNEQDGASEVYILAGPGRPPSQIEKDARTVIEGVTDASPQKVLVCQIHEALESAVLKRRIRLCEVTTRFVQDGAEVAVVLDLEDERVSASCQGISSEAGIAKLACAATLAGVEKLFAELRLSAAEVKLVQLANYRIVTALIQVGLGKADSRILAGTCLIEKDTYTGIAVAGARSALNALNRLIERTTG